MKCLQGDIKLPVSYNFSLLYWSTYDGSRKKKTIEFAFSKQPQAIFNHLFIQYGKANRTFIWTKTNHNNNEKRYTNWILMIWK